MAIDSRRDEVRREVLPIPDKPPVGLTTYDAKEPDTRYPPIFSTDETVDVGMDRGSRVSSHYRTRDNAFNGEVTWVELDVDQAAFDQDHILTGAERFHVAMAVQ